MSEDNKKSKAKTIIGGTLGGLAGGAYHGSHALRNELMLRGALDGMKEIRPSKFQRSIGITEIDPVKRQRLTTRFKELKRVRKPLIGAAIGMSALGAMLGSKALNSIGGREKTAFFQGFEKRAFLSRATGAAGHMFGKIRKAFHGAKSSVKGTIDKAKQSARVAENRALGMEGRAATGKSYKTPEAPKLSNTAKAAIGAGTAAGAGGLYLGSKIGGNSGQQQQYY